MFAALLACSSSRDKGAGSGAASGSAPAPPPTKERTTLDITLPASSGKPPTKTTSPVSRAALDRVAAMRFDDFSLEVNPYPVNVAIRQRAQLEPKLSVNIFIAPCNDTSFKCRPMSLDAWQADKAQIENDLLDPKLQKRADTTFEIEASSIAGAPLIGIYQAAQFFGKDDNDNPVSSYSLAYSLYYNDGVNFLRVSASYSGQPYQTLDEMRRALPRAFLAKAAVAFLDVYGQTWAP